MIHIFQVSYLACNWCLLHFRATGLWPTTFYKESICVTGSALNNNLVTLSERQ